MAKYDNHTCEIDWFYNKDVEITAGGIMPYAEATPAELERFTEWQAASRTHSDKAEAAIKKLIVKLATEAPQLDYTESLAAREQVIEGIQKEYSDRKSMLDGEHSEFEQFKVKLRLSNMGVSAALDTVTTYLEFTQLKEIAIESKAAGNIMATINKRLEDLIYPNYTAEIAGLKASIVKLKGYQDDFNRQLPAAIIRARLSL